MSQQVYEPKLFAHGTVPGSRTYVTPNMNSQPSS